MITTIVLLAWFGSSVANTAVNPSDVVFMADITGTRSPGCALMIKGEENDFNLSGTCDEVRKKLGLGTNVLSICSDKGCEGQ